MGLSVKAVTALAIPSFILEACSTANKDILIGKDFKGPFKTSDEKDITLDFSDIENRAEELTVTVGGSNRVPISAKDASPYPVILVKNGKPVIRPHDEVKPQRIIGEVTDDLVLRKVRLSTAVKDLYEKGEIKNIGLYPTPSGLGLSDVGRKTIDIEGNDNEYYVLRVVMNQDASMIEDSKRLPAWVPLIDDKKDYLLAGCLVSDLNGKVLGFEADSRVFDKVK